MVDTFFMSVDMLLWGWACDNLDYEGTMLLNVRPIRSKTKLPPGMTHAHTDENRGSNKLFGNLRAHAVIDIMLEPLSETSVRFAFQMSDTIPPFFPSWVINYIVQNAMADIFDKMREVAVKMYSQDKSSEHVQHCTRPQYQHIRRWFESRIHDLTKQL